MKQGDATLSTFVFPGQGSQTIGMLEDFAAQEKIISKTFSEASDLLGYDLWKIVQEGPDSKLNSTEITQPALLTSGVAIWRLWSEYECQMPNYLAGHSLGEYTALVCAGSINFEDAVTLVRDRGIYMQDAVAEGEGAMAAIIGLAKDEIVKVCSAAVDSGIVSAANFNSPVQTVIAGQKGAVIRAMELAKEAGAKRAMLLPVSVPSHCSLMKPATVQLGKRLDEIEIVDAIIPVIQNVDAIPRNSADEIKRGLIQQLHQPVLWVETINRIAESQCKLIIESGPGKVLTGLIKRMDLEFDVINLHNLASFQTAVNNMT
jgi:[acyl-carrier-protein] S-malonyltransferase